MGETVTVERVSPYPWSKQCVIGSFFWLCVLVALEPGVQLDS
jgi:hypothetical protein